ncbi:MAG: rod shape-determining protein MreD [Sedimentisphaerales bacterium]|nr:rod shape-determining protein MreD [Sedimentisphaerales bacterium]
MRWFNFVLLLFVTLVLQLGVGRLFGVGPQRVMPDLLLLLAVVLAFRGPADQALIACWILGLVKDLSSQAPLGSYAFAFGLLAWAIVRLREMFYGEHPITLIVLTFLCSFLAEIFVLFICSLKKVMEVESYTSFSLVIMFSAMLTAGLAPYGQWLILKLHRQLGLPRRRIYGR